MLCLKNNFYIEKSFLCMFRAPFNSTHAHLLNKSVGFICRIVESILVPDCVNKIKLDKL